MSRTGWGGIFGVVAAVAIGGLWGCSTDVSSHVGVNAESDDVVYISPKVDPPQEVDSPKAPVGETAKLETPAKAEAIAKVDTPAAPATPPAPAANARPKNITYDDLKFDMPSKEMPFERSMLTPQIESLDGKRVKVRGYMLSSFTDEMTRIVLMRDNQECCFGPGAWIYDCVLVEMVPGKTAQYSSLPVTVEGVFSIKPYTDGEGVVRAVYHIDGEKVR